MSLAVELNVEALHIRSDSRLIVEQVKKRWRCKDDRLRLLRRRAWELAQNFPTFDIEWIPREENVEADALCRAVISASEQAKANPFLQARSHSPIVDIM